jgi:bifunctional non-homologous end joining protein LigD
LWDELDDKKLTSQRYTIQNIFKRLERRQDPWKDVQRHAQSLVKAQKKLSEYIDSEK